MVGIVTGIFLLTFYYKRNTNNFNSFKKTQKEQRNKGTKEQRDKGFKAMQNTDYFTVDTNIGILSKYYGYEENVMTKEYYVSEFKPSGYPLIRPKHNISEFHYNSRYLDVSENIFFGNPFECVSATHGFFDLLDGYKTALMVDYVINARDLVFGEQKIDIGLQGRLFNDLPRETKINILLHPVSLNFVVYSTDPKSIGHISNDIWTARYHKDSAFYEGVFGLESDQNVEAMRRFANAEFQYQL